jgi:hypothetical protein
MALDRAQNRLFVALPNYKSIGVFDPLPGMVLCTRHQVDRIPLHKSRVGAAGHIRINRQTEY